MASKKDKKKIDYSDSFCYLCSNPESTPFSPHPASFVPPIHIPPIYICLPTIQYLFSIEKDHSLNKTPNELALSYLPPDFHWISEHPQKNLAYYTNILIQTNSIHFSPIYSKASDSLKIRGNIAHFVKIISEKDWGSHPSALRPFVKSAIPYSYYD